MTKPKSKPKPAAAPKAQTTDSSAPAELSPEAERQFEVELCWCIQQLQSAIGLGKLNPKQVQEHTKALNTLMSKTAPIVKKRQVMRLSFGDYRSKMAAEEKRFTKVNQQVKVLPAKPSVKSKFVRKSGDNNFKFNFDIPKAGEEAMQVDRETHQKETCSDQDDVQDNVKSKLDDLSANSFHFLPSANNFRFNFDVIN